MNDSVEENVSQDNTAPAEEILTGDGVSSTEDIVNEVHPSELPLEEISAVQPEIPVLPPSNDVPSTPPSAEASNILAVKADGDFLTWAIDSALSFLDLADLERVKTAESLRGIKENAIRDKVQMANSVLVLVANYASQNDNKELVSACEVYAEKMKTIIKRLCL